MYPTHRRLPTLLLGTAALLALLVPSGGALAQVETVSVPVDGMG